MATTDLTLTPTPKKPRNPNPKNPYSPNPIKFTTLDLRLKALTLKIKTL